MAEVELGVHDDASHLGDVDDAGAEDVAVEGDGLRARAPRGRGSGSSSRAGHRRSCAVRSSWDEPGARPAPALGRARHDGPVSLPAHPTRGILHPAACRRSRGLPARAAVADLVRWFWVPEWDVDPGRTSRQHVVGYPGCNLVVESREGGFVGFAGPTTRASHQDLTGRGWAVGALLQPAAVPAFSADPAADRDRYRRLDEPALVRDVTAAMTAADPTASSGRRGPGGVRRRAGGPGRRGRPGGQRLRRPRRGRPRARPRRGRGRAAGPVTAHAATAGAAVRRAAPAAVVRRRRLQEAAERVRCDPGADLAGIAADLGYADHGHLTREFRRVLGTAPSEYRRATRQD